MLFISIEYIIFLPIVFLIYWTIGYMAINDSLKLRLQNVFVVIASYVFYGWWDWRFLLLIICTSFCSWGSGLLIEKAQTHNCSKFWMISNIIINLLILGAFKYYNFFVSEFGQLLGIDTDSLLLHVILPVGVSFYTFQALSYSIDIYRKKIYPTKDIIAFFAFIAFFPQLVAGPIERATNLLPQFLTNRKFSYEQATDGMRQILWGLFKKMVVADNCASYVDQVWSTYPTQTGSTLLLASILFAFQIYGDFSGYSDIAIGTAKLFGIKLRRNFNNPYFSRDIAEFWRRWHISLTTWFRDYVYIPLGGSRVGRWKIVRNTFVVFLISGLWHGANWTFLLWGVYHALLFLPLILLGKNRKYVNQVSDGRIFPSWRESIQMLLTFALVVFGWIFFRATGLPSLCQFIRGLFNVSLFSIPNVDFTIVCTLISISMMLLVEWFQRYKQHGLEMMIQRWYIRYTIYMVLIITIIIFYGKSVTFIYFQF